MNRLTALVPLAAAITLVAGCRNQPLTPEAPKGPSSGMIDQIYEFSTVTGSQSPEMVAYRFYWGDGDTSEWSEFVPPRISVSRSHAWRSPGNYSVRAEARDLLSGVKSDWSTPAFILIKGQSPDTYPATVRATVPTSENLVCPPNTDNVYVTGEWDDAIYVIRTSDNVLAQTLRLRCGPTQIACSPNGDRVYIGSSDEVYRDHPHRLYSLRTSSNTFVDSVDLLGNPQGVACLPNGQYIYVSLGDSTNKVAVVRASDFSVVTDVPVGSEPGGITALPSGQYVYVACTNSRFVYVIRTSDNTVAKTIDAGSGVNRLAALPSGEYVYVTRFETGAPVMVVRTSDNTVVDSIPLAKGRRCGIAVLPGGRYVYVTNRDANCVDIIRTSDNKVVSTVAVGNIPNDAACLPDGSGLYVANRGSSVTYIGF
ncbi:MAG TPA: YncE family protein [bacterium]|nr:YncE family protein [bacterium]